MVQAGISPAARIAANNALTCCSSSALRSTATTLPPRRAASKACRPKPQPRSSTRSSEQIGNCVKSTVSMEVLDGATVDLGGGLGHRVPGVVLLDSAATGNAQRAAPRLV